jgi:hypothetical protein
MCSRLRSAPKIFNARSMQRMQASMDTAGARTASGCSRSWMETTTASAIVPASTAATALRLRLSLPFLLSSLAARTAAVTTGYFCSTIRTHVCDHSSSRRPATPATTNRAATGLPIHRAPPKLAALCRSAHAGVVLGEVDISERRCGPPEHLRLGAMTRHDLPSAPGVARQ